MTRRRLAKLIVVFAALSWPAMAADLDLPKPKPRPAPVSAPISMPAADNPFTPPDAACTEWTDGCRVCTKPASGEATCSNPGIACTPRTVTCSRR
jgi:hypothetical protein